MSECQRENISLRRTRLFLCVCERGSGTEIEKEGVEIAKCGGASNCFHFSLMTTVPCGGTETQIACQSRETHSSWSSGRTSLHLLSVSTSRPAVMTVCTAVWNSACVCQGSSVVSRREMSSLYSRSKDLSSRSRKSLSDSPPSSPSPSTKTFRVRASCVCLAFVTL